MEETKTKSKRTTKSKVDKYNGFKIQPRTRRSTKWTIYIYGLIKEANVDLLSNEQVKIAFNNLVDCLLKYEEIFETWIPSKYYKYSKIGNGIIPKEESYKKELMGIPGHWLYDYTRQRNDLVLKEKIEKDSKEIVDTYMVLYELIKRDVVPYMELKQWEITSKKDMEYYHNQIEKVEKHIKDLEALIDKSRKTLCEYAEKAVKLSTPPPLTRFV
jgi:hypothetical protein